jgi:hypothetical protein
MAITVKHNKVSTIPDTDDTSLVRPSDWNADHTLVGTIDVANGGTGANTLTGYVKGNGTSAMTASATIPSGDITGFGTIATQNANAVAITGGTIDNTTIGATTPAAGTFTTITGQTEVLKGTGTNLVLRSQALATSPWSATNLTVTNNSSTAPDSTSTATLLVPTVTSGNHYTTQSVSSATSNSIYTLSFYVKAAGYTAVTIANTPNAYLHYDLTNVVTSTLGTGWGAATITAAGSGWYRCTATNSSGQSWGTIYLAVDNAFVASGNSGFTSFAGNGTSGVYFWGVQLEQGTVANTYVPTTTAAIFGGASLSFQNAASISLDQFGALSLQPAGTGALQAQATTSSTVGGNARGANAVDFQMVRSTAAQVASASTSFIGNGRYNTASGQDSVVVGGYGNTASSVRGVIAGGESGTASGNNCYVGSGYQNTAAGNLNFIGGGQANSGTSGSSVTTQTAATTSGSTAVTLAASNASIKVGQWVEGTGVNNYTYVAAVSGTSLTLSANASSTNAAITLTFKTPHGVVVGGGNNQATGSYSFIGGGGDAGTAANRNVASGSWSAVCGGAKNTASGDGSFVGGGGYLSNGFYANLASGNASAIVGGILNQSTSQGSFAGGGYGNLVNGVYATISGGSYGTTRSISGYQAFPAHNNPISQVQGITQVGLLVLAIQTTDATATALRSDSSAASGTNQVILPNNSAYFFTGEVVSGVTGGGNTKGWTIEGVIKRGADAASTALVGTPTVTSMYADLGAATWTIAVTADTTNGGLRVTFTGQASTTIRTVCQIRTTEMTY